MKRRARLKVKTPLARKSPLKPVSKKTAKRNRGYRALLDLTGLACQVCGTRQATERHHVYELSGWPALACEPLNLLGVCGHCHRKAHKSLKTFRHEMREKDQERMSGLDKLARACGKSETDDGSGLTAKAVAA